MKRILALLVVLCVCFVSGCAVDSLEPALSLRNRILTSSSCEMATTVTADYGDSICSFSMQCHFDPLGNMTFTVTEPEVIADICGSISGDGGSLTFDEHILAFPVLADGQLTPVCAPWIIMHALRSGYIRCISSQRERLLILIDDSYGDDAVQVNIWLNAQGAVTEGEILWKNRRILSVSIRDFQIQ